MWIIIIYFLKIKYVFVLQEHFKVVALQQREDIFKSKKETYKVEEERGGGGE